MLEGVVPQRWFIRKMENPWPWQIERRKSQQCEEVGDLREQKAGLLPKGSGANLDHLPAKNLTA